MTDVTLPLAKFFAWIWSGNQEDDFVDLMLNGAEQFGLVQPSAQEDLLWELTDLGQAALKLTESR